MSDSFHVREAGPGDRDAIDAMAPGVIGRLVDAAEMAEVIVVDRAGLVVGCGGIDPQGHPTEDGVPALRTAFANAATDDERRALIAALLDRARARDLERVLIGCDPMDHARLKRFLSLGFRPTGRGPYHLMGGGMVQYVTGYQDATGATLDLAIDLSR